MYPKQNDFPLGTGSSLNALITTINTVNTAFLAGSSSFVGSPAATATNQIGGGVWERTLGGYVQTNSITGSTIDSSKANQLPVSGSGTCKGTVKQEYFGVQTGFDFMTRNVAGTGTNIHFGAMVGYIGASTRDTTAELAYVQNGANYLSPAGAFKSSTDVPFAGLYSTFTNGNFFADSVARFDYYDMRISDPYAGVSQQSAKAYGAAVAGNMGYRFQAPSNWFIEPSAGFSYSKTWINPIDVPGRATTFFGDPVSLNGGTVVVDDVTSALGRASLRVGVNVYAGSVAWQPFLTASVFHEFAQSARAAAQVKGPEQVVYKDSTGATQLYIPPNNNLILNTSTERIGTFYQFGAGSSVVFGDSGWLAYVRADYRTGENTQGLAGNVGLRFHW